jgi:hypothetical protein
MLELTHGCRVYLEGWTGIYDDATARVFTVRGYATEIGRDPDALAAQTVQRGQDLASTIATGTTLVGDRALARRMADEQRQHRATAHMLRPGQQVRIEGTTFTVRVPRGNETSPRNSDPIHFQPMIEG